MFELFKKSNKQKDKAPLEEKSLVGTIGGASNVNTSASVVIGQNGSLIGTIYYSAFEEIEKNISVNTIVSKQSSIVNESILVVKEKSEGQDKVTDKEQFLDFLSWIDNPNSYPFPRSRSEIFTYILENSYKKGIFGVIYVFDKQNNFKHIRIPKSIELQNVIYRTKYRVCIKNETFEFNFNPKYRNFARETDDEIMVLQVGGKFNNDIQNYAPIFSKVLPYILLQNYLIDFATSFHANACFPSQIVTLNYITDDNSSLSPRDLEKFNEAVESVKLQLKETKSAKNAGGIIIPSNPNIKVTVTPLSIPTNAKDNIAYQDFVSQKIYGFVDGGSADAFEGKSEYSNNASAKLQDLYDGSFRLFNSLVIDPMNQFMQGLIGAMNSDIAPRDYYLAVDISNVRIYQKQFIAQDVMLTQNNLLTINEGREILSKTSERYSFLTPQENGDVFNSELSGNATKPRTESQNIA